MSTQMPLQEAIAAQMAMQAASYGKCTCVRPFVLHTTVDSRGATPIPGKTDLADYALPLYYPLHLNDGMDAERPYSRVLTQLSVQYESGVAKPALLQFSHPLLRLARSTLFLDEDVTTVLVPQTRVQIYEAALLFQDYAEALTEFRLSRYARADAMIEDIGFSASTECIERARPSSLLFETMCREAERRSRGHVFDWLQRQKRADVEQVLNERGLRNIFRNREAKRVFVDDVSRCRILVRPSDGAFSGELVLSGTFTDLKFVDVAK